MTEEGSGEKEPVLGVPTTPPAPDTIISIISDADNTLQLLERRVRELRASIGM